MSFRRVFCVAVKLRSIFVQNMNTKLRLSDLQTISNHKVHLIFQSERNVDILCPKNLLVIFELFIVHGSNSSHDKEKKFGTSDLLRSSPTHIEV